jgi:hypothetical protein
MHPLDPRVRQHTTATPPPLSAYAHVSLLTAYVLAALYYCITKSNAKLDQLQLESDVLPHRHCLQAVVGGTASSGVIICCLRVITKAALPPTRAGLRSSTALYFALSGLLSLACFVVYYTVLPKLGIVQYYKQKKAEGECRGERAQA